MKMLTGQSGLAPQSQIKEVHPHPFPVCGQQGDTAKKVILTDQCTQMMNTSLASTTLTNLNLAGNNLFGVPANILALAVGVVDEGMVFSCIKLLDTIPSSATLIDLDLRGINLSGLLAMAVGYFKNVRLSRTLLTTNQCVKVSRQLGVAEVDKPSSMLWKEGWRKRLRDLSWSWARRRRRGLGTEKQQASC